MEAKNIIIATGYDFSSHKSTTPPKIVLPSCLPKADVTSIGYKLAGMYAIMAVIKNAQDFSVENFLCLYMEESQRLQWLSLPLSMFTASHMGQRISLFSSTSITVSPGV